MGWTCSYFNLIVQTNHFEATKLGGPRKLPHTLLSPKMFLNFLNYCSLKLKTMFGSAWEILLTNFVKMSLWFLICPPQPPPPRLTKSLTGAGTGGRPPLGKTLPRIMRLVTRGEQRWRWHSKRESNTLDQTPNIGLTSDQKCWPLRQTEGKKRGGANTVRIGEERKEFRFQNCRNAF